MARDLLWATSMQRVVLLVVLLVPALARADASDSAPGEDVALYHCKDKDKSAQVALTFKPETELKDLLAWAMGFTCKNFIYDPSYVQRGKKVTVVAPNTLSAPDAYRVFLVALSTIGLTVVPKGSVLRIVESATARGETVPIFSHGLPENSEQVVRYVLRPAFAAPATVMQALATMKSSAGDVQLVGSVLMITDYATTVRDMMAVAKLIDVPGGSDGLYTIPVLHADAEKLSKEIEGILAVPTTVSSKDAATAPPPTKVLVDTRTNQLIVLASDAGYQRIKALVDRLDPVVETGSGGSLHIYPLKSAIAEEVAKTLNDSISNQSKSGDAAKTQAGAAPSALAATAPISPTGAVTLDGQAHVIADKATNKLIVMSTGRDFIALKSIIQELDEPRREVYIEAMIIEVQLENDLDVGASAHGGVGLTDSQGNTTGVALGGVQMPSLSSVNPSSLATASGLVGGLIGTPLASSQSILGLGTSIPSYGILFQALAKTMNTTILSAPSIVALDNEEAKYKVGTNIPYQKGVIPISAANPLSAVTTNIDRQDLLLELDIKPHISSNDTVLLEVKHESKDLAATDATLGPSWSTRSFETRVVVRDQQTVVIGGLMQTREQSEVDKVPILGDIPLLGRLFSYTTKTKKKTNLLIMLTPYIVRDQEDLENIRQRRIRDQDEFVGSLHMLDGVKWNPRIDYSRKRGLVEEINRSVLQIQDEAAARAELVRPAALPSGPVAPGDH